MTPKIETAVVLPPLGETASAMLPTALHGAGLQTTAVPVRSAQPPLIWWDQLEAAVAAAALASPAVLVVGQGLSSVFALRALAIMPQCAAAVLLAPRWPQAGLEAPALVAFAAGVARVLPAPKPVLVVGPAAPLPVWAGATRIGATRDEQTLTYVIKHFLFKEIEGRI